MSPKGSLSKGEGKRWGASFSDFFAFICSQGEDFLKLPKKIGALEEGEKKETFVDQILGGPLKKGKRESRCVLGGKLTRSSQAGFNLGRGEGEVDAGLLIGVVGRKGKRCCHASRQQWEVSERGTKRRSTKGKKKGEGAGDKCFSSILA